MIRVVVVDDDFMVAKIHSGWVERTPGFEVVGVAHTAAQARNAVVELGPDLLLLDVHLPDRTGLDLLQELHADGYEVDALMITAARDAETVQRARRRGAVDYIVKPFDYETLKGRLEQYAGRVPLPESVAQSDVDELFQRVPTQARGAGLPKGLSAETEALVVQALKDHAVTGRAQVALRYGTAGRPERHYCLR